MPPLYDDAARSNPPGRHGAIAMAVYRPQAELIRDQLASIQAQTYSSWLCHVVIDGLDDTTASLVEDLVGSDDRFVVHHFSDNVGFYRNFERAVALAGEGAAWVALADQDDRWDPTKLARLVSALEPGVTGAMCQARVVSSDGDDLGSTKRRLPATESLLLDNQVTGSLAVFTADVVRRALPFPAPTSSAYHDHWLGLVAVTLGRFVLVDEILQSYVQHPNNVLGEEGRDGLRVRIGRLTSHNVLDTLAIERWGWRRTMAIELDRRFGNGAGTPAHELERTTRGLRAPRLLLRAVRAGDLSPGRASALAAGWGVTALKLTSSVRQSLK